MPAPEEPVMMYLRFSDRSRYEHLHLSTALEDWDMSEEMKQCTTIDQYFIGAEDKVLKRQNSTDVSPSRSDEGSPQEIAFHPSLWLVVDPNIVMPYPGVSKPLPPDPHVTHSYKSFNPDSKTRASVDCSTVEESDDETLTSSSEMYTEDDHGLISSPSSTHLRRVGSQVKYRKAQVQKSPSESWPRPPINYCNLISLALRNSEDGSLNVQQIYSFVREHFPFFRVAPDGWKNTVRHNLCFSSSFEKSAGWVCADGHRRSCLWKLTRQGRRKFRTEMHSLSDELLHVLRKSMNKPALMELMFGM